MLRRPASMRLNIRPLANRQGRSRYVPVKFYGVLSRLLLIDVDDRGYSCIKAGNYRNKPIGFKELKVMNSSELMPSQLCRSAISRQPRR